MRRRTIKSFAIERAAYDFLITLAFDQLFDRFPGVRIASVENGSDFLPDLFKKLRSTDRKMPGYFTEDPVESFRRNVWINPFWEDDVEEVVELMGADRVIFGSDWPHIEGMPRPLDYATELKSFDDATQQKILRDNARALNTRRPALIVDVKFAVVGTDHLHVVELVSGLLEAGAELAAIAADGGSHRRRGSRRSTNRARTVPTRSTTRFEGVDVVVTAAIPGDRAEIGDRGDARGQATCSPTSPA